MFPLFCVCSVEAEYNLQSFLDISNKKLKCTPTEDEEDEPEHRVRAKRRTQRYRAAWETYPEFSSWIKPVESDDLSAQCTLCSSIMKAEITVLKRHYSSARHINNVELAESGGGGSVVNFHFRKEWEKNKHFMHWIGRVENNDKEACCTVCQVRINANTSELKLHSRSEAHQKKMAEIDFDEFYGLKQDVKPTLKTSSKRGFSIGACSFEVPTPTPSVYENPASTDDHDADHDDEEDSFEISGENVTNVTITKFDDLRIAGLISCQLLPREIQITSWFFNGLST